MTLLSFEALESLKNALAGAGDAKTCRIGFEATISPDDYPIIRVVPSETTAFCSFVGENTKCVIYFGHPVDESTTDESGENIGLEGVYQTQMAMRDEILERLRFSGLPIEYKGTIFDEDRIAGYKLMGLAVNLGF